MRAPPALACDVQHPGPGQSKMQQPPAVPDQVPLTNHTLGACPASKKDLRPDLYAVAALVLGQSLMRHAKPSTLVTDVATAPDATKTPNHAGFAGLAAQSTADAAHLPARCPSLIKRAGWTGSGRLELEKPPRRLRKGLTSGPAGR